MDRPLVTFLVIAGALIVAVIVALSYRLWRIPARGAGQSDDGDESVDALGVLRDQKRELDAEVAAGRITAEERETRIAELTRRVHDEGLTSGGTGAAPVIRTRRPLWIAALVAMLVPVIAIPIYLVIGNPTALDPAMRASAAPAGHGEMSEEQIRTLLGQLQERLAKNPDDAKGWTMLGRGLRIVNDFAGSAAAFEKANVLKPDDAAILADWADSVGMTQNKSLEGKPRELIQRALKADPQYPKALALAASAEFAAAKFPEAKKYWERLLAVVPPDSASANEIRGILAQLDNRAGGGGSGAAPASPAQSASAAPGTSTASSASTASTASSAAPKSSPKPGAQPSVAAITGTVKIAPALASKIVPGDSLFIFARAVDGPRMPLAIIRATAGELPKTFRLDDSMAMAGGPALSSFAQVKVEARVSKSGDARPWPGDLRGESVVLTPGMSNIELTIDTVVK